MSFHKSSEVLTLLATFLAGAGSVALLDYLRRWLTKLETSNNVQLNYARTRSLQLRKASSGKLSKTTSLRLSRAPSLLRNPDDADTIHEDNEFNYLSDGEFSGFLSRQLSNVCGVICNVPEGLCEILCSSQDIPSFGDYVALRIMGVESEDELNAFPHMCEALRTMGDAYLKARGSEIAECFAAYGIDKLCALRPAFLEIAIAGKPNCARKDLMGIQAKALLGSMQDNKRDLMDAFLREFEGLLFEYFSFNWHRIHKLLEANISIFKWDGLVTMYKPKSAVGRANSHAASKESDNLSSQSSTGSFTDLRQLLKEHSVRLESRASMGKNSRKYDSTPSLASASASTLQSLDEDDVLSSVESYEMAATSSGALNIKQRQRAMENWKRAHKAAVKHLACTLLKPQREFKTTLQLFKDLHRIGSDVDLKARGPVLLLLGGGMAAGKSTVRNLIGQDVFWSKVGNNAVVIEADAIKNQDVVFKELSNNKLFEFDNSLSKLVHEYSTQAAESLLVAAVNEQKDIVFDGTMMWRPFVEQTVAMVRDYKRLYRRGPGYCRDSDGNVVERYWEPLDDECQATLGKNGIRRPYRIELVGVTCDPGLAVARGIWRYLRTGRGVPVESQLRSHRLISENWEHYAQLVDSATLYHTGSALTTLNKSDDDPALQPKVIAHRSQATRFDMLVHPEAYQAFQQLQLLQENATSRTHMFKDYDQSESTIPAIPRSNPKRLLAFQRALRAAENRVS